MLPPGWFCYSRDVLRDPPEKCWGSVERTFGGTAAVRLAGGNELRELFLGFFESKAHKRLESAPLVPYGDPTLLLVGAGMVPFKPYYMGKASPPYPKVTTCQRCIRTPDIDRVGKTARHATFFEMLGNFSFGGYFKHEAIVWAWEFVTTVLDLPPEKLWVSVYQEDDEACDLWSKAVGVPEERIVRLDKSDNFWEIGVGPCGPCSELYLDRGPAVGCGREGCGPGCDCERFMEFWNLVFVQFFKDEAGNYLPLERKGIDTGMGLERAAAILQGKDSIFDIDLVRPVVTGLASLATPGRPGDTPRWEEALRVITDHLRGITFMVMDGIMPSNEGRGYILRRLIRRAVCFGRGVGFGGPFLSSAVDLVVDAMRTGYPQLPGSAARIRHVVGLEEERFRLTLDQGSLLLDGIIGRSLASGTREIPGGEVFRLYDTYGFPVELTAEIAGERGVSVDDQGFKAAMAAQRERARAARVGIGYLGRVEGGAYRELCKDMPESDFVGYHTDVSSSRVVGITASGRPVPEALEGTEVELFMESTPFYPEGGGQVSDRGELVGTESRVSVEEVFRPVPGFIAHKGKVTSGRIGAGDAVICSLDRHRRRRAERHHTATHLLHGALRDALGEGSHQSGSLVAPDRLRFDFTCPEPIAPPLLREIELAVNQKIMEDLRVDAFETSLEDALGRGAVALFGEKYSGQVRVVSIGEYSMELCGGTHVTRTGQIGVFKILAETAVSAGTRRIEAVAGEPALAAFQGYEATLLRMCTELGVGMNELPGQVTRLLRSVDSLERENRLLLQKQASLRCQELLAQAERVDGANLVVGRADGMDVEALRAIGDELRAKLGSAVVVLGSCVDGRVVFVSTATKDLVARGVNSGDIVRAAARIAGGGGGGKPEMAQAGGKDPSRVAEALEQAKDVARQQVLTPGPKE